MNVLSLKNISYQYPKSNKEVLKDVSVDFKQGNIYAIMGKSGAGKTSLLSLIAGLDSSYKGNILYEGRDLRDINRNHYRSEEIGVVFQNYNLLTNATALENIVLSMNISRVKIEDKISAAYEILKKVGIDSETANRKILNLSGGEQQRTSIARAISHNPSIIIADEPTGSLDIETEHSIIEILRQAAKADNRCIIIVTHSNKVASYADMVWRISEGKLHI
mgnify:CR=1 FL=1